MAPVIRAIVFSAIAQVAILATLVGYLFIHVDTMSQKYSAMALANANAYTDEQVVSARLYTDQQVRDAYNAIQIQVSDERSSLKAYVDKRLDLKLSEAMKEAKQ